MRPCWAEIDAQSLEHNYQLLNRLTAGGAELLAVVKADAYGHSLALCAPAAARRFCPEAQVLVMSGCFPGEGAEVVAHRLTAVVWEPWHLDELEAAARAAGLESLPVHLEIDTGMSRQGTSPDGLREVLSRLSQGSPLRLECVLTHLLAADETDGRVTEAQLARLDEAVGQISASGLKAEWLSVGNSAALLNGELGRIRPLAERWGMKAMVRTGLALYGVAPKFESRFEQEVEPPAVAKARALLKPVMSWKTRVVSVRTVPADTVVGYNGTFVATEPMRLALLALGYADGLDRQLGNRFDLLVRGERAPLVGRLSMDLAVLDVTDVDGVEAGDEVVILGTQAAMTITAFDHGEATGTIPWEVFTRIGARVRRVEV
jgi:alanine racemase